MKRFIALTLAVLLALPMLACGGTAKTARTERTAAVSAARPEPVTAELEPETLAAKAGKLIEASGEVYIVRGDKEAKAKQGQTLRSGTTVVTGANGSAKLDLGTGKFITLGKSSAVKLTKKGGKLTAEHIAGEALHDIKPGQKKNAYSVSAGGTTMAVLGTLFVTSLPAHDLLAQVQSQSGNIPGGSAIEPPDTGRSMWQQLQNMSNNPPSGTGDRPAGSALLLEGELNVTQAGSNMTANMIPGDTLNIPNLGQTLRAPEMFSEADLANIDRILLGDALNSLQGRRGTGDVEGEGDEGPLVVINDIVRGERNEFIENRGPIVFDPNTLRSIHGIRYIVSGSDIIALPLMGIERELGYRPIAVPAPTTPKSGWYPGELQPFYIDGGNITWHKDEDDRFSVLLGTKAAGASVTAWQVVLAETNVNEYSLPASGKLAVVKLTADSNDKTFVQVVREKVIEACSIDTTDKTEEYITGMVEEHLSGSVRAPDAEGRTWYWVYISG